MTAQDDLKAALRDRLGPAARRQGYKGSAPNWRKSSTAGDWAVVNVQSSSFSSAQSVRCVVNIAFAPEPWLRWTAEKLGAAMPKAVVENVGLYRQRLHPRGTEAGGYNSWWEVCDGESARSAVEDIVVQLDRAGWPVLDAMFSREAMMTRLHSGDLGMIRRTNFEVFFARAEALMLMDSGPSDALEERLKAALTDVLPEQREHAEHLNAWIRAQAART